MGAVQRYTTDAVPPADRLTFWNEGSRAIGGVEVEAVAEVPFYGDVARRSLGDIKIFSMKTGPHRAAWTRRLIEQCGEELHLRLWFQETGTTIMLVDGVEHVVSSGEWFLSDGRRPSVSIHPDTGRKIALQLPIHRLLDAERDAIRKLNGGFHVGGGIAQMLWGCLESALEASNARPDGGDDRLDGELGEIMVDLARMLLRERWCDIGVTPMRDITQDRIRAFVRRNLGNPALSVDMIARAMKCSKRYIHKVFNGDQTISEFIWNQRLEQCRSELMQADARSPTLTQIAFENGFSSSAHFSRAFRTRYGVTPRAFRAEMGRQFASRQNEAARPG